MDVQEMIEAATVMMPGYQWRPRVGGGIEAFIGPGPLAVVPDGDLKAWRATWPEHPTGRRPGVIEVQERSLLLTLRETKRGLEALRTALAS